VESICDESFIDAFLETYEANSKTSDVWKFDHIARVFVGVPYGLVLILFGKNIIGNETTFGFSAMVSGYVVYASIWFTIIGAGYVNDSGHNGCALAVAALKYQDSKDMSAADNLMRRRYFEDHRVDVLRRMDAIANTSGLKFVGSVITVQKALAVGSVLITIMNLTFAS
jgi:hypothetical protein